MKTDKTKELFLEQIRKIPIVLLACEKLKIGRTTVYRWRVEDKDFKKKLEDALTEGEENINEMSEVQLVSLIKEKSWQAVSFWLRHRHPKFQDKIEIDATIRDQNKAMTPEKKEEVRRALDFAGLLMQEAEDSDKNSNNINSNNQNYEPRQQSTNEQPGTGKETDSGSEKESGKSTESAGE